MQFGVKEGEQKNIILWGFNCLRLPAVELGPQLCKDTRSFKREIVIVTLLISSLTQVGKCRCMACAWLLAKV